MARENGRRNIEKIETTYNRRPRRFS